MKIRDNSILRAYANQRVSDLTRAWHLFIFNWLFIAACVFLVPINIATGDTITLLMLPLCIALTVFSQFLIKKESSSMPRIFPSLHVLRQSLLIYSLRPSRWE